MVRKNYLDKYRRVIHATNLAKHLEKCHNQGKIESVIKYSTIMAKMNQKIAGDFTRQEAKDLEKAFRLGGVKKRKRLPAAELQGMEILNLKGFVEFAFFDGDMWEKVSNREELDEKQKKQKSWINWHIYEAIRNKDREITDEQERTLAKALSKMAADY